ncbi:C-terminal binding protein [Aggregatilinea lenta]|uniref:C-terminal binding protein n=1 Tax=Aggregatilinea lenta TaxID=913108 RepID=UPI000E5BE210|nr:C-terminal binding protein [Aggregatilinea lenta]
MSRGKIVMLNYEYDDLSLEQEECAKQGFEFAAGHCSTDDEFLAVAGDAVGIVNVYARVTPRVAEGLKNCKVIARTGAGYDLINVEACRANGIEVCYVPDYCVNEVADHAVGLLIAVQRKILQHHRNILAGKWDYQLVGPVARLNTQTLGLIGLGRIGRHVVRKIKEIIPTILVYDPYLDSETFAELGVQQADLDTIFEQAHIISLHAPLTPQTHHIISAESLARMRKHPFIINVSRGALIDLNALIDALQSGQVRGAGIDVLESEPDVPPALKALDNIILTPHAAWYSQDAEHETRTRALADVIRVINGEPPRNPAP